MAAQDPHLMTQAELKLWLGQLTAREQAVSDERRILHAWIDALRKELVGRMRDEGITVIGGEDFGDPGSTGVRDPRPRAGSEAVAVPEPRNPISADPLPPGGVYCGSRMSGSAAEHVVRELSARAELRRGPRRPHHRGPPRLDTPDPTSIRVLSERRIADRCAVAVTVNDLDGERYFVIAEFADEGDGLRGLGGCEGPDRDAPGRHGPYLGLYAHANRPFFGGGRVQSDGLDIARVRLVWTDGHALEDVVQNGVAMFFGARESLDVAMVEFLDQAGRVVGSHQIFGPDER